MNNKKIEQKRKEVDTEVIKDLFEFNFGEQGKDGFKITVPVIKAKS